MVPGSAASCNRAATFAVSPIAVGSIRKLPLTGPKTTGPLNDNAALEASTDQLVAVTTEQGFAFWSALGTIYRGWITVTNGDLAKGISLLRNGLTAFRANGMDAWTPCYIAFLARACAIAGRVEEALALWDDALQIVERHRRAGSQRN